jgi:hypothetical protein
MFDWRINFRAPFCEDALSRQLLVFSEGVHNILHHVIDILGNSEDDRIKPV